MRKLESKYLKRAGTALIITGISTSLLAGCTNKAVTQGNATPSELSVSAKGLYVIPEAEKHTISDKEQEVVSNIRENIESVYRENGVLDVIVGVGDDNQLGTEDDNYILQIYNDKRQCYTEASNSLVSFYYDTGKAVMATTKVEEVSDVTVLDILTGALNLCEAGVTGCTIEVEENPVSMMDINTYNELNNDDIEVKSPDEQKADEETSAERTNEVIYTESMATLTIKGLDNIKKVYAQFSNEQADNIIKSWEGMYTKSGTEVAPTETEETTAQTATLNKVSTEETTQAETQEKVDQGATDKEIEEARKNDKLIFNVYWTDQGGFNVACQMEVQGLMYTSWLFDGYTPLNASWDAGEGWASGLTQEEYLVLLRKVQDNIEAVMNSWQDTATEQTPAEGTTEETTEETETTSAESTTEETTEETETTTAQ